MSSLNNLSLEELRAHAVETYRRGGGSRPDVLLVRVGGKEAVLKDYGATDPMFRRLVGPLSARREARALSELAGVRGVPKLLGVVGPRALLLEHIAGKSARELRAGAFSAEFFRRFYRLIDAIHARGIAHCDLRSTGNILLGPGEQPWFVDFAAHFRRGRRWNLAAAWAFRKLCEADRAAVARLKKTHAPALLTEEERVALKRDRKTPLERGARMLGKSIRNVSRFVLTRRSR